MTRSHCCRVEPLEQRQLLSAGQLDSSFGTGGISILKQPDIGASRPDLAVLPDGRILLSTQVMSGGKSLLALARFTRDGNPDKTFGGHNGNPAGVLVTNVQYPATARLKLLDNGQFIVYGHSQLARFNSNGTLDRTFQRSKFNSLGYSFNVVAVDEQDDGKLVLGASYRPGEDFDGVFAVLRLNANGSVDTGWATGGMFQYGDPVPGIAMDVRVMSNGSIVAAGQVNHGYPTDLDEYTKQDMVSLKLDQNGDLDTRYGQSGIATRGGRYFAGAGVTAFVSPEGVATIIASSEDDFFYRFTKTGAIDPTFGTGGQAVIGAMDNSIADMLVQSDGSTLYVGKHYDWPTYTAPPSAIVARLTSAGALDTSFATTGQSMIRLAGTEDGFSEVTFAADGRILIAANAGGQITLSRYWREEGPIGELTATDLTKASTTPYRFSVTFRDDVALNLKTLDAADIRVIRPGGSTLPVAIVDSVSRSRSACTVTFKLAAPSGAWSAADNGMYQVRLLPRRIYDNTHHAATGRTIGTFAIRIRATARPALAAALPAHAVDGPNIANPLA